MGRHLALTILASIVLGCVHHRPVTSHLEPTRGDAPRLRKAQDARFPACMFTLDEAPEPAPPARSIGAGAAWIVGPGGLDVSCAGTQTRGAIDFMVASGPGVTLGAPGGLTLRVDGQTLSGRWGDHTLAPTTLSRRLWWHVTVSFDAGTLEVFVDGLLAARREGGPTRLDLGELAFEGDGATVDEVAVFTEPVLASEALTLELVHRGRRPVPGERDLPTTFVLDQSPGALTGAAFGPEGRLAATWIGSELLLWDTSSGSLLRTLSGDSPIERVLFSPDGALLAITTTQDTRVHEVLTGDVLHRQPRITGSASPPVGVPPVVSPRGDLVALARGEQTVLWDARTGALVHTFEDRDEGGDRVVFDATGDAVFRIERDRILQRWSSAAPTLTRSRVLGGIEDRIHSFILAPSGKLLVWARDAVHTLDPVTLETLHVTPAPNPTTPAMLKRLHGDLVWARHANHAIAWREGADGALSPVFEEDHAAWLKGQLPNSVWKILANQDRLFARLIQVDTGKTLDSITWTGVEAWPESLVSARMVDLNMVLEAGADRVLFTPEHLPRGEALSFHPTRGVERVTLGRGHGRRMWRGAGVWHEVEVASRGVRFKTEALRDPMYVPQLEFSEMGTELLIGTASRVRVVRAWSGEAFFEADVLAGGYDLGRPGGISLTWNPDAISIFDVDTGDALGREGDLGHVVAAARARDGRSVWVARKPEGLMSPAILERRALDDPGRVLESHDLTSKGTPFDIFSTSDDGTRLFIMDGQEASLWALDSDPKAMWTTPTPPELGFTPSHESMLDDIWIDAHGIRLGATAFATNERTTVWLSPDDGALRHLERGHGVQFLDHDYAPGRLGQRCVEEGRVFERVVFEEGRLKVLGSYPSSDGPTLAEFELDNGCATRWEFSDKGSAIGVYTQQKSPFSMTLRYTAPDGTTRRMGKLGEPRSAAVAAMGGDVVSTVHVLNQCIEHFMPLGRVGMNCGARSPLRRLVALPDGKGILSDGGPQGSWIRWQPGRPTELVAIPPSTALVVPTLDPNAFILVTEREVARWSATSGWVWRTPVPHLVPIAAIDSSGGRVYVGGHTEDDATAPTLGLSLETGEVLWERHEGEALVSIDVHDEGGDWVAVNHRGEVLWYGADGALRRRVQGSRDVAGMSSLSGYRTWIEDTPNGRRVYLSMSTSARLRVYDHATGRRYPDLAVPSYELDMFSKDVGASASMVWRRQGDSGGLSSTLLYRGVGRSPLLVEWDEDGNFAALGELPKDPPVYGVRGLERVGLAQIARRRNRPDLLYARDPRHDPARVAHYRALHERRVANLPEPTGRPPAVRIRKVEDLGDRVRLSVDARAKAGLGEVTLRAQGVVIERRKLSGTPRAQITFDVPKTNGVNTLEVESFDMARVASEAVTTSVAAPKDLPSRTFFLGVGVSSYDDPTITDLSYADDDVRDVLAALQRRNPSVMGRVLVDGEVTWANLDAARDWLAMARPQDTVVVMVSGHGMHTRGEAPDYYFLTPGAQVDRLERTALPFAEIESLVAKTPARQRLVLLDTCQSGALAPNARAVPPALPPVMHPKSFSITRTNAPPPRPWLYESRLVQRDLERDLGAIVLSSSRGFESSWERDDFQNGVFTEAILEALSGAADLDRDDRIDARELLRHVIMRVPVWTGGMQNPTVDRDNPLTRVSL